MEHDNWECSGKDKSEFYKNRRYDRMRNYKANSEKIFYDNELHRVFSF
jgi:hypothetical protein